MWEGKTGRQVEKGSRRENRIEGEKDDSPTKHQSKKSRLQKTLKDKSSKSKKH